MRDYLRAWLFCFMALYLPLQLAAVVFIAHSPGESYQPGPLLLMAWIDCVLTTVMVTAGHIALWLQHERLHPGRHRR